MEHDTSFEAYLRREAEEGKIDFRIRIHPEQDGLLRFYIHPLGQNGHTLDFQVQDNQLTLL